MSDSLATEDTIELPVPEALAADFVREESWKVPAKRSLYPLRLGSSDLGMWRIDGVTSEQNGGNPRMVAKFRRVLP